MKPFVKWAGGKRQILSEITERIKTFRKEVKKDFTYYEPFVGGGAVFLGLKHNKVVINDKNSELMNAYRVIRDNPQELIEAIDVYKNLYATQGVQVYYDIRRLDRDKETYDVIPEIQKAARTIFLNKTCYNGLYRVNSKGQFNTPAGKYTNISIYDKKNILSLSKYFKDKVTMYSVSYEEVLANTGPGDIIYIDPPYDYEDDTGFTGYQKEGFTFSDFEKLKKVCDQCIQRESYVIISNNATERVINLFKKDAHYQIIYEFRHLNTKRSINSKGDKRSTGKEVIIMGSPVSFPQANSLNKILKLLSVSDAKIYKNNAELLKLLGVTAPRQINYYLSSLKYLGLINDKRELTESGKKILSTKNTILKSKIIANTILSNDIFKNIYEYESTNVPYTDLQLAHEIKKVIPGYSDATYKRRATTVKKWLYWCREVKNSN